MRKVYIVYIDNGEFFDIKGIYSTKVKAEKAILKFRDDLIEGWKNLILAFKQDLLTDKWLDNILLTMKELDNSASVEDIKNWVNEKINYYQNKINIFSNNNYLEWKTDGTDSLSIREYKLE